MTDRSASRHISAIARLKSDLAGFVPKSSSSSKSSLIQFSTNSVRSLSALPYESRDVGYIKFVEVVPVLAPMSSPSSETSGITSRTYFGSLDSQPAKVSMAATNQTAKRAVLCSTAVLRVGVALELLERIDR